MIKEKKEKNRKNKKQEITNEFLGYFKTAIISFLAAAIFTVLLSFHARSEMIKNLYVNKEEKIKFERQLAKKIVAHSDFTKSLSDSNYSVCLQVGNLYEAAGDYPKAEYAFYLATQKAPNGVYTAFYKLTVTLIELNKIEEAEKLVESIPDTNNLQLIRFKTRAYIVLGDRYNAEQKYLKAANHYEKAYYYYSRLNKVDKVVKKSIEERLVNAYIETASIIVENGYNSDAIRFLNKALKIEPNNNNIKYRLAIIYSDLDPIKSLDIFEHLMKKVPQNIDYNAYIRALMKSANIKDIEGDNIKAKLYRYKVHSLDLFIDKKVIYNDDIEINILDFKIKKRFFRYKIIATFNIQNNSAKNIDNMTAEFILKHKGKNKEIKVINCANKKNPLISNGGKTDDITIKFGKNIFTKKELENYYIDIYLYKDSQFKTLAGSFKIPKK